jgi:signal transduction histidine kinase
MGLILRYPTWRTKTPRSGDDSPIHGRCQAGLELRPSYQLLQAAIDTLPDRIAILDGRTAILAANRAWRTYAEQGGFSGKDHGIGTLYLDFIRQSTDHEAAAAEPGIVDVLRGYKEKFSFEYPVTRGKGRQWFQLRVGRFDEQEERRLIISHEDVTDLKAALDAQRDLDGRILRSREEERGKIARELHDSTVQRILAINLNLAGLKALLQSSESRVHELLAETLALGRECMREVRTISYLMRPPLQEGQDFIPALCSYVDGFCKRSSIRVHLVIPSQADRMPAKVENALFRVVQEALSNIHRHARSATATVAVSKSQGRVILEVRDQGKGMPHVPASEDGYWTTGGGLAGARERIRELRGSLEIKPAHPGTLVRATVPLKEDEPETGTEAAA